MTRKKVDLTFISMISRFRSASELEQSKKNVLSKQSFLRQKIIKGNEQLKKLSSENRKKEVALLISQYLSSRDNLDKASIIDLNDISFLTDQKLEEIRRCKGQMMTPVTENGGETLTQGEQEQVNDHVQELSTNVDALQNLNWSMDFTSAGGGNEILTSEDVIMLKVVGLTNISLGKSDETFLLKGFQDSL